jgi:hypothetical protein
MTAWRWVVGWRDRLAIPITASKNERDTHPCTEAEGRKDRRGRDIKLHTVLHDNNGREKGTF